MFLGRKIRKAEYESVPREIEQLLTRLGIEKIDFYQVHGIETQAELDTITDEGGALGPSGRRETMG